MPKFTTETRVASNLDWLASRRGIDTAKTLTLDGAEVKAKVVDGVVPSGLPLAVKNGKGVPYKHDGTADEKKLVGVLLWSQEYVAGQDPVVAVLDAGRVYTKHLAGGPFTPPAPADDKTALVYE